MGCSSKRRQFNDRSIAGNARSSESESRCQFAPRARRDKTVSSVSRPLRRCELDSRQLRRLSPTDRTYDVRTRSQRSSRSRRHDRDRTILSCLAAGVNRASQSPGSSRSRTVRRLSASPTGSDVIGQPGHVIVVVVERKQYLLFVGHVLSL